MAEGAALLSGDYAKAGILCCHHHDQLDGLNGNAVAYFRNFTLIASGRHLATGELFRTGDISPKIDGRNLERWFLKLICGAVASRNIAPPVAVAAGELEEWVRALFVAAPWPEQWAIYLFTGTWMIGETDRGLRCEFVWTADGRLNGLTISAFTMVTPFSIEPPDSLPSTVLRRPPGLGARVRRPNGGDVLVGLPEGSPIEFRFSWP